MSDIIYVLLLTGTFVGMIYSVGLSVRYKFNGDSIMCSVTMIGALIAGIGYFSILIELLRSL